MQQTAYSVDEVDGTLAVCVEILSGEAKGRNITIDYSTSSGTATGKLQYLFGFHAQKHVLIIFSWR